MSFQPDKSYLYVNTDSAVDTLIAHMKKTDRVAIDVEADSFHHYYEKVCLIQLTAHGKNFIIDPLAGIDLSQFLQELSAKVLIIHDAGYDLRMLLSSFNFVPGRNVFDTMQAAQLLGYERFSLAAVLERFFNVVMSKQGQKSDWSRRPLSQSQLQYAITDTCYLEKLADLLSGELDKLNRSHWHRETCEHIVRSALAAEPAKDDTNAWYIKGVTDFNSRELAFVRELWYWRDKQSQRADLPPFKVLPNQKLLDLARWGATHRNSPLREGPRLPRNCTGQRLETLEDAMRKAADMPQSDWPGPRKRKRGKPLTPECRQLIKSLLDECSYIAYNLELPPSNLASRATLTAVALARPKNIDEIMACGSIMRWQADILAPRIYRLIK